MFQVCLGHLQHRLPQGWHAKPLRHLMAQDAHALRDGADIFAPPPFAGDDQNQPRAALRHLNMARRDGEYGEPALRQMIEIFLNPENETNWDNLNVDAPAEPNEAVKAAERLLREMPSCLLYTSDAADE